jgi:hypothetical protein
MPIRRILPHLTVNCLVMSLLAFAAVAIVAATAAQDELAECEALVKPVMVGATSYFRLGHRLVRETGGQYTLHLTFFAPERWLATCRLARQDGRYRVVDWELAEVAARPHWLPGAATQ